MKNRIVCLLLLLFIASCKDEAAYKNDSVVAVELNSPAPAMEEAVEGAGESESVSKDVTAIPTEAKIIKTSNLRFETEDINESYQNIQKAINKHKATIQNDVSGKDYASSYRNVIIRIPNVEFTAFINEISQGVNHFDRKEISSQDVTEQYIDLEARMNAKKKLEKRYLELLSKANKVSEILEIEKQLAVIREEIEAKEGQLKYLQSQISMSTVTIEMYTNNASESGVTVSYGSKIWNAVKSGFNGLSSFILGLISIWPFIIIFVILFIFIRRRFKRKTQKNA
ncbi:DUF4349 domain-containing protein [Flavobacterium sp.]|uniref:DUF4349 domain-containing protein n=1 Tax=Flavobacterium sp. TaxID=239 RepID=UPI002610F7D2|nr:DUF4349 domain-containing protein [Flavobacterium sp.]